MSTQAATVVPSVYLNKVKFSDQSEFTFADNDFVLIVGPNNSGKSAALRAIEDKLSDYANSSPVIANLQIRTHGSDTDVLQWLANWAKPDSSSSASNPIYSVLGNSVSFTLVRHYWPRGSGLSSLARVFCKRLDTDSRLTICNPPENINLLTHAPTHPIHVMQRDDAVAMQLSHKFKEAFGLELIVNHCAGSQVPLHVGKQPAFSVGEDRVSIGYITKLEQLPTLHSQGDGMRAFAGVLMSTAVGRENVYLIDEPEAFLHPPQAKFLGKYLAHIAASGRQVLVATHSADFLKGALDAATGNVKVLRIDRLDATNKVSQLETTLVKTLWSDPIFRASNILDGLFHERTIVCESDSDCRFYSSMLDAQIEANSSGGKRPDFFFTQSGGKDRMHVVVSALRAVNVPVAVVADFDVLSNEQPLRRIVESLQGSWDAIQADWKTVKSAIDVRKPEFLADEAMGEIKKVLDRVTERIFPDSAKDEIAKLLRKTSPWATAKTVGKSFVPSGDASAACQRLLESLRTIGMHVVEEGEIEGFCRSVGNHGPKWVNAVLERNLANDSELESARKFVKRLAD